MGKQHDGDRRALECVEDLAQPGGVVGVVCPVDRGEHERGLRIDPCGEGDGVVSHRVAGGKADVGHHIADQQRPLGEALRGEVVDGDLEVGARSRSATWSVTILLCSSGMRRLGRRSPASRWASLMCCLTAASAAAAVELVSP